MYIEKSRSCEKLRFRGKEMKKEERKTKENYIKNGEKALNSKNFRGGGGNSHCKSQI